jgi:hypothetical protein
MEPEMPMVFSIRRAFVWSLGVLLGVLVTLAILCIVQGQPGIKIGLLGLIILLLSVLLGASLSRRLVVDEDCVVLHRLGQTKTLRFFDMTAVESLMLRKRVFLTLCAGEEFIILSNAYGDFPALVKLLLAKVPAQSISDDTRSMAVAPPVRHGDIVSCWLAIALVLVILWHQLSTGS